MQLLSGQNPSQIAVREDSTMLIGVTTNGFVPEAGMWRPGRDERQ